MADQIKLYEHPEYKEREPEFRKHRDLYECKHAVLSLFQYLWPHELELSEQPIKTQLATGDVVDTMDTVGSKLRRVRVSRTRFLPIAESIVSMWVSFLFGKDNAIVLNDEAKEMLGEELEKDIDGEGTDFATFVKWHVAPNYFLYGKPIILVDAPSLEGIATEAEKKASGWRPRMEVLDNLDVKDWQLIQFGKDKGKYQFIRYEYQEIQDRRSSREEPVVLTKSRELSVLDGVLTSTTYRLEADSNDPSGKVGWRLDGLPVQQPGLTAVPVSTVKKNEPWLCSIADMILVAYNLMSAHWNGLNSQAFQRIFISGKLGDKHTISLSEYAVAILPEGAQVNVIDPTNPAALEKAINAVIDYIYRMAFNRTRTLSTNSNEAPAADTLREMREEMLILLKSAASEIENLLNQALKYFALFKLGPEAGAKFNGKVTLNKDLTIEDFQKQLDIWAIARDDIKRVFSWYKAFLKKLAEEQKFSEDEEKEILDEITKMKPEPKPDPLAGFGPFLSNGDGGREGTGQVDTGGPKPDQGGGGGG